MEGRRGTVFYEDGGRVSRKDGIIRDLDGDVVSLLIGDTLITIPMARVIRIEEAQP